MEGPGLVSWLTIVLLAAASTRSSPVSQPSSPSSSRVSLSSPASARVTDSHQHSRLPKHKTCSPVEVARCSTFYNSVQMPNVFGESSQLQAEETLRGVLSKLGSANKYVTSFLCSIFIPPCPSGSKFKVKSTMVPLPCRATCEEALRQSKGSLTTDPPVESWPVRCHSLPTENCFAFDTTSGVHYVKPGRPAADDRSRRRRPVPEVARFASLQVELGTEEDLIADDDDDDEFKVEVVSLTSGQIPERLFDIPDLGDPRLFQGWVDVQGKGVANDYCRVVGKGNRKFLSCKLAGSGDEGHHYVSKLGVELGHAGTWFMRDMDGDGRDDYCRCVGKQSTSRVTCMKAGEKGFYGSSTQGGSEHSFTVPNSEHCHHSSGGQASAL